MRLRQAAVGALLAGCVLLWGCSQEKAADGKSQQSSETATRTQTTVEPPVDGGGGFDFYVLSLSWSPSYCEAEGDKANGQQCRAGRPYAFVVHGLWPQYERGYPEFCGAGDELIDSGLLRSLYDIMPSAGLIRHQWNKHGSCSGLSQEAYFALVRRAREHVAVPTRFARLDAPETLAPQEAEAEFLGANPGLPPEGIAVTCDRRFLREVRICLTRDLAFRTCPEIDRRSCKAPSVVMPPVRVRP